MTNYFSLDNHPPQIQKVHHGSKTDPAVSHNGVVALDLAQRGFYVFPCQSQPGSSHDKAPLVSNWREVSTRDSELIGNWWHRFSHALVAIDCGKSAIVVIDADRHGLVDGVSNLKEILSPDLSIIGCPIVETAGNGLHLYFSQSESELFRNSRGNLPPGIDVRGDGGYVIAPGSKRRSGEVWSLQEGSPDLQQIKSSLPFMPASLSLLIKKTANSEILQLDPVDLAKPQLTTSLEPRAYAYAAVALREETHRLAAVTSGVRNTTLNGIAYRLGRYVARGWLSQAEVQSSLINACQANGLLKEGQRQVIQTIASGLSAGMKNPYPDLPDTRPKNQEPQEVDVGQDTTVAHNVHHSALLSGFIFDGDIAPKPPAQLVKKLIPKCGICFIGGQSGAGKTFVAVDLAVSLASGSSFFSYPTIERVGVVILAAEGAHTLASRIEVAKEQKAPAKLLPIAWLADVPNLTDTRHMRELVARLKAVDEQFQTTHGVRLGAVICDTLDACFAIEDENDNSKAAAVIRHLKELSDRLNVVVIPVHHYGKSAETGLRGASAWRAGSDVVLSVLADRDHVTGACDNRRLTLAKSRSECEGWQAPFKLSYVALGNNDDGDEIGACYIELCANDNGSTGKKQTKLSRDARAYCQALSVLLGEMGKKIRPYDGPGPLVTAVDREHVREEFYRSRPAEGDNEKKIIEARRKAFLRGEEQARESKAIALYEVDGRYMVWLVREDMETVHSGS